MAALYPLYLESGASATLKLRLTDIEPLAGLDTDSPRSGIITSPAHAERAAGVPGTDDFAAGFDALFTTRQKEAEEFYESRIPKTLSADAKAVMRQSFAGMFWSKQFYHRSEEHTSELQSRLHLVCRLLLEKKKKNNYGRSRQYSHTKN